MSDQHRAWTTGCYGEDNVTTPNIDDLADQGTLFENAFCTSPLCGPSRGSFVTGTHPHTNGLVTHPTFNRHGSGNVYRPQRQPGVRSLFDRLREEGYQTHASGYTGVDIFDGDESLRGDNEFLGFETMNARMEDYVQQVGSAAAARYQSGGIHSEMWEPAYFNVDGKPFPHNDEQMFDSVVAEDARQFLDNHDRDRPFCLYVGFRAPHPPWYAPREFHDQYDPDDVGSLPDWRNPPTSNKPRRVVERHQYFDIPDYTEGMVRRSIAAYHAFVAYMDDCVGRVLNRLDDVGQRENTLVVYCSDHGDNLYRHGLCEKHTFYEDSIRIPLIFSLPDIVPEGRRTESLASLMDVMPTVLSMTDVSWPDFVEGRDLQPAFEGEDVRDHVFSEYYHSLDPCRMVRNHRYKYIHTEGDVDELYDLSNDPDERTNLAWYSQYADLVERMDQLVLDGWEIPEIPSWGTWNDLNERKQRQRLEGLDIADPRPEPPDWVEHGPQSPEK